MSILDRLANRMGYRKIDQTDAVEVVASMKDNGSFEGIMTRIEYSRLSRDWIKGKEKGRYVIDGNGAEVTIGLDQIGAIWAVPVSGEEKENE